MKKKENKLEEFWNKHPKLESILEDNWTKFLAAGMGVFLGVGDVVTTGYPILTIGLPLYGEICRLPTLEETSKILGMNYEEAQSKRALGLISYSIGASIPFGAEYNSQIIEFISRLF